MLLKMNRITINKNNYGTQRESLDINSFYTDNIYLYMFVSGFTHIKSGDFLMFDRKVYSEETQDNTPVASKRKIVYYAEYLKKYDVTLIVTTAEPKTLLRIKEVQNIDEEDYILTFEDKTNVFAQDVDYANHLDIKKATIQKYNPEDNSFIDIIDEIFFNEINQISGKRNYEYDVRPCCMAAEFLDNFFTPLVYNTCDNRTVEQAEHMYYYLPFKTRDNVLATTIRHIITENDDLTAYIGQNLYYSYNTFYCQESSGTTLPYDLLPEIEVYECYWWKDKIRGEITEENIDKYNKIEISKIMDFWGISVGLTSNNDYSHLYQEENIVNLYTENVKNKVISSAPVIDMEKMKFSPHYEEDGIYYPITSITYNLHFRQRDLEEEGWNYIEGDDIFWNPEFSKDESGETIESGLTPEDLQEGEFSDMLYYLGFTDDDVQYQKMKLKKSFLRLSFYSSTDPLTQKLLYYSTIFFDSGELLGKYIKAKNQLIKEGQNGDNVVLNSETLGKYRLDCRFIVKNEYCTTKSSDGFNIYYFPDDVIDEENSGKTIYMKVEFNHAKYGRTIPMIMWPESGLTMESLPEALYIPLKLKYLQEEENINEEKAFVYVFDDSEYINREDNTLEFNLVEPKLL